MCIYGVPYIISMFRGLQKSLNSLPVKSVPLEVRNVCGNPFEVRCYLKKFRADFPVGVSHIQAAGHLLYRSIEISIKNLWCLDLIGQ